MNKKLYVVDEDGVVVDVVEGNGVRYDVLFEGDRIIRKATAQYLSDTTEIKYRFIKINPLAWSQIAYKYPILNKLVYYVDYTDNILSYRNGKFVQSKDIPKLCNVSQSTASRQLQGLIKEDVIHKIRDKKAHTTYLMMNPFVCMRGKKVYKSLYTEFGSSKWKSETEDAQ